MFVSLKSFLLYDPNRNPLTDTTSTLSSATGGQISTERLKRVDLCQPEWRNLKKLAHQNWHQMIWSYWGLVWSEQSTRVNTCCRRDPSGWTAARSVIPQTQTNSDMRETDLLLKAVRQLLSLILKYKLVELKTPQQCGIRVCVCVCVCMCVYLQPLRLLSRLFIHGTQVFSRGFWVSFLCVPDMAATASWVCVFLCTVCVCVCVCVCV